MTEDIARVYAHAYINEAKEFDYVAIVTCNFTDKRIYTWSGGKTPEAWDREAISELTKTLYEAGADLAKRQEHTRTHNFVPRKNIIRMENDEGKTYITLIGFGFAVRNHSRFWVYVDYHRSYFGVAVNWNTGLSIRFGVLSLNFYLERND